MRTAFTFALPFKRFKEKTYKHTECMDARGYRVKGWHYPSDEPASLPFSVPLNRRLISLSNCELHIPAMVS